MSAGAKLDGFVYKNLTFAFIVFKWEYFYIYLLVSFLLVCGYECRGLLEKVRQHRSQFFLPSWLLFIELGLSDLVVSILLTLNGKHFK